MEKAELQKYTQMIEKHQVNKPLLFSTLAQIEKQISKNAYLKKKFANADECFGSKEYHTEMLKYMGYRSKIHAIVKKSYNINEIKSIVSKVEHKNIVTGEIMLSVVELICNSDYSLIE